MQRLLWRVNVGNFMQKLLKVISYQYFSTCSVPGLKTKIMIISRCPQEWNVDAYLGDLIKG